MCRKLRTLKWVVLSMLWCAMLWCVGGQGLGQVPLAQEESALRILRGGTLVLWIVHETPGQPMKSIREAQNAVRLPTTVQEQTAGSFGTAAGKVGQTAGSYGQSTSSVGQAAGKVGQSAGSYGQTAGSFGTTAGSVGKNAGSYGQSAGSFGETLNTVADAAQRPTDLSLQQFHHPDHSPRLEGVILALKRRFQTSLTVVDVREDEFEEDFQAARGTSQDPDVVLGDPLPPSWWSADGLAKTLAVEDLGTYAPGGYEGGFRTVSLDGFDSGVSWRPAADILSSAPHPEEARAFIIWLCGGMASLPSGRQARNSLESIAGGAVASFLVGGEVGGNADPERAEFDGRWAQMSALGLVDRGLNDVRVRTDILESIASQHLAIVSVRAIVTATNAFGVLYAQVVLRKKGDDSQWRVLQITPRFEPGMQAIAADELAPYCRPVPLEEVAEVKGILQASPLDGDNRTSHPELAWDNKGGAELQVVEWQMGVRDAWSSPELTYAQDHFARSRTQITAPFSFTGRYRWRVWSVGKGGVVVLSPWRTVNIVGR